MTVVRPEATIYLAAPMTDTPASHPRLFVLEQGKDRPSDYCVGEGTTDMLDCPVSVRFGGGKIHATGKGYGPSVFVLPGARRVQPGSWTAVEPGAQVSWAGRDWLFMAGELPGSAAVPPRGVLLNGHGTGHAQNAVLLEIQGDDRGNFWRFRSEPVELAPGVLFTTAATDDGLLLELKLRAGVAAERVQLDDKPVAPGTTTALSPGQRIRIAEDGATPITVVVITGPS